MIHSWQQISEDLESTFDVNYSSIYIFCSIIIETDIKEKSLEEIRKIFNFWDDENRDLIDKRTKLFKNIQRTYNKIRQINKTLKEKGVNTNV